MALLGLEGALKHYYYYYYYKCTKSTRCGVPASFCCAANMMYVWVLIHGGRMSWFRLPCGDAAYQGMCLQSAL